MMNNGHHDTKIQAYLCSLSESQSKMITINYITGNIVHSTLLSSQELDIKTLRVVPLRKRIFAPAHFQIELNLFK